MILDHRYNKEGPNTMIFTSNKSPNTWGEFFNEDSSLLCALDRIFDMATFFMIRGKGLNVDKLKAKYQELMKQKNELTSTYKKCEKDVQSLNRKLENLNQYLVQTQTDPSHKQQTKNFSL